MKILKTLFWAMVCITLTVALIYPATVDANGLSTQDLNSGLKPTDLVNRLLGKGVTVSNVTFKGVNVAAGTFRGGTDIIGFEEGIILSSGDVSHVIGPNVYFDISWWNWPQRSTRRPGLRFFNSILSNI